MYRYFEGSWYILYLFFPESSFTCTFAPKRWCLSTNCPCRACGGWRSVGRTSVWTGAELRQQGVNPSPVTSKLCDVDDHLWLLFSAKRNSSYLAKTRIPRGWSRPQAQPGLLDNCSHWDIISFLRSPFVFLGSFAGAIFPPCGKIYAWLAWNLDIPHK